MNGFGWVLLKVSPYSQGTQLRKCILDIVKRHLVKVKYALVAGFAKCFMFTSVYCFRRKLILQFAPFISSLYNGMVRIRIHPKLETIAQAGAGKNT